MLGRNYVIQGRVQGVGFRVFTREQALRLNIHGWVRNLSDGSLECEVAGTKEQLALFEIQIRRGPLLAKVEQVFTTEINKTDLPSPFEIRR